MKNNRNLKFSSFFLVLLILFSACSSIKDTASKDIKISWLNTDGTLIETTYIAKNEEFEDKKLPLDTNEWHYTEWKIIQSNTDIICIAQRVAKIKYLWKNHDGSIIKELYALENEPINAPLLQSNKQWLYEGWNEELSKEMVVYTAKRQPNPEYFKGNIFQIILKDEKGTALSTGSGCILNDDGWFITNNHVMEGGSSAIAFFDIKNPKNGERYTQLPIRGGSYYDSNKDFFIGKIDNYEIISDYYQQLSFTAEYNIGEITYSIGYPNSSLYMQINQGSILEEYADIHDKISGKYYILSDSYIAPGSSGGILINENFEILGITTIGLYADEYNQLYLGGGSLPTALFKNYLTNFNESDIKNLRELY